MTRTGSVGAVSQNLLDKMNCRGGGRNKVDKAVQVLQVPLTHQLDRLGLFVGAGQRDLSVGAEHRGLDVAVQRDGRGKQHRQILQMPFIVGVVSRRAFVGAENRNLDVEAEHLNLDVAAQHPGREKNFL